MEHVVVVGVGRAKPGQEEQAEEAMRTMVAASHEEEGCLRYKYSRDTADPARFVIVELWRSQADLDAHFAAPHMAVFMAALGDLEAPPDIYFCEPRPVGDPVKGTLA